MHRRLLFCVGALALVAATCGGASSGGPAEPGPLALADTTTSAGPPAVLRLGLAEVVSFDPVDASLTDRSTMIVLDLLFDGLTEIDPSTGAVVADLAEDWVVSDNGLTWRFDLFETTFSDGTALTADDVKWSIERIAAAGVDSLAGGGLAPVRGYAGFVTGETGEIAGIVAADDRLVIRLREPFGGLAALLANPVFGVAPQAAVEVPASTFATEPVGSGPFMVTGRADDVVSLAPTDHYGGELDGIELVLGTEENDALDALLAGDTAMALVPPERLGEADHQVTAAYGATVFYGMNVNHPDLADVAIRRAIIHAVDRADLAETLFAGGSAALAGIVPEPGRDVCGQCQYDPDLAAQLIEFAYAEREVPTIGVDFLEDSEREQTLAEAVAAALAEAGIPTELRPASLEELQERISTGEQELFRFGWVGPSSDAGAWLTPLFRSDGEVNVFGLADDAVDGLIDELAATADPGERDELSREVEAEVLRSYVVVPILAIEQAVGHDGSVDGLVLRLDGTFAVDAVTVG